MITSSSPFGRCIPNHPFVASCIGADNSDYTDLWVHHPQRQASPDNKASHSKKNNEHERSYNKNNDNGGRRGDKWARAREMVFSCEDSAGKSSNKVEIPSLVGVSSLVQKWRGFEVDAKGSSRRNPNNIAVPASAPSVSNEDDSIGDWESDRTAVSGPPSSRGIDSDVTENERLRVADIIRKLTDDRLTSDSLPHLRTSSDQSEQRCFSPVINSPRMIRGRQAFHDLLLQMERERNNELRGLEARKAVSKCSHRGRIQALLRVRFLRRSLEAREGRQLNGAPADPKRSSLHTRERFNSSDHSCREEVDSPSVSENIPTSNQEEIEITKDEGFHSQNIMDKESSTTLKEYSFDHNSHESSENVQENSPRPQLFAAEHLPLPDKASQYSSCEESELGPLAMKPEEVSNLQVTEANYDVLGDSADSQGEECVIHLAGGEISHPEIGWEEEKGRDWICEVSRPRGDWEDLRKARYQEMLDPFSENEEIRSLLQRGTVSSFLSSGLREQIDQVMLSRAQGQVTLIGNRTQEEEKLPLENARDKDSEVVLSEEGEAEDEVEDSQDEERDEFGIYYDEYEETDQSSTGQQYNEYMDRTTSTHPPSWPQHRGHDVSDYSYPVASSSTYQSLSSTPYSQDHNPSSTTIHPANEMDLLYDLKGHMDQLHQEISELRRSIKCCMTMQMKLQRSIKQEVAITSSHQDDKNAQRNRGSRGRCYICYKRQVDSLLYRCGHMCTCSKCAQELQQGGGKCPICSAPIMDIIQPDLHF
ncbi:hypothetical protein F511_09891 [Dorcoceras hygrometricum]|uniref:RING-type domain-containing protein n=1 Tax=Dorcoceras hygrometricum TaxID=472368 RepID=A0A2Z7CGE4_9LAMI|nr:hypothetical protein F511_09891 [Dorcoceras hygrometricum]